MSKTETSLSNAMIGGKRRFGFFEVFFPVAYYFCGIEFSVRFN